MRIRSIKPEYTTDRVTGRWALDLQMFYAALWCFADDDGRFEWEPDLIRAQLFPFHPDLDVDGFLNRLVEAKRVRPYEVDGIRYGLVINLKKHQKPNKPTPSRFPTPPGALTESSGSAHGGLPEPYGSPPVPLPSVEEGRGEGIGEGGGAVPEPAAPALPPSSTLPPDEATRLLLEAAERYRLVNGTAYGWPDAKAKRRDVDALAACLQAAGGDEEEVWTRWQTALVNEGWPKIATLVELQRHWTQFGNPPAVAAQRLRALNAGGPP